MLWKAKGYELTKLENDILLDDGLFVFGTGRVAENNCNLLFHFELVRGLIDNSDKKQGQLFHDFAICSLETFLSNREKEAIIVMVDKKNYSEIRSQLLNYNLIENRDFFYYEFFYQNQLARLLATQRKINYVELVQVSVTERCTLKCRNCAHACHLVPYNREDLSFEVVKTSIDTFFSFTDYVKYFVLIGGEPLLYRYLKEAIIYIAENYAGRYERLQISTNGSLVPSEELLDLSAKHQVFYMISNYSKNVSWMKEKLTNLIDILGKRNIAYALFSEETEWMDYGFDWVNRENDEQLLQKVFDKCKTGCHEIRGTKFYFCVMARSVSENMMEGTVGADDYLDLSVLNSNDESDRRIFLEYTQGYSEKGYLEMCKHCNGAESCNYPLPAAVQLQ